MQTRLKRKEKRSHGFLRKRVFLSLSLSLHSRPEKITTTSTRKKAVCVLLLVVVRDGGSSCYVFLFCFRDASWSCMREGHRALLPRPTLLDCNKNTSIIINLGLCGRLIRREKNESRETNLSLTLNQQFHYRQSGSHSFFFHFGFFFFSLYCP